MADQLKLTYSGFDADIEGGSFTLRPGVNPSTGTLILAANVTVAALKGANRGTLRFQAGGNQVSLTDIYIDSIRKNEKTGEVKVELKDRRWLWPFHTITGEFNQIDDSGKIRQKRSKKKSIRKLAELVLEALGERSFDVRAISNRSFPHKVWNFANAQDELEKIADETDTVVVLTIDNKIEFKKRGLGSDPKGSFIGGHTIGEDLFDGPDTIKVVGNKNIFQIEEILEPMAEIHQSGSTDDKPKTRLKKLSGTSYLKTTGAKIFGEENIIEEMLHEFSNLVERDKVVARQSVGKVFGGVNFLPIHDRIALKQEIEETLGEVIIVSSRPIITGDKSESSRELGYLKKENEFTTGGFNIDAKNGLIFFDDRQLVRKDNIKNFEFDGDIEIAKLKLTYAFKHTAQNKEDGPDEDSFYTFTLNRFGGKNERGRVSTVFAEELQAHFTFNSRTRRFEPDKKEQKELDKKAAAIARDRLAEFTAENAETIRFIGVEKINPSGRIESVRWEMSKIADTVVEFTRTSPISVFGREKPAERETEGSIATQSRGVPFERLSGDARFCINKSGIIIPALGMVVSDGIDESSGLVKVKRPVADAQSNLFICENRLEDNHIGKFRDSGTYAVKYTGSDPTIGDILGTETNLYTAKAVSGGGMVVRGVLDTVEKIAQVKLGEPPDPSVGGGHFVGVNTQPQMANHRPLSARFDFVDLQAIGSFEEIGFKAWFKDSTKGIRPHFDNIIFNNFTSLVIIPFVFHKPSQQWVRVGGNPTATSDSTVFTYSLTRQFGTRVTFGQLEEKLDNAGMMLDCIRGGRSFLYPPPGFGGDGLANIDWTKGYYFTLQVDGGIYHLGVPVSSFATGGTTTTLIDTTESWADDEHNGRFLEIVVGNARNTRRLIVDTNSAAQRLTVDLPFDVTIAAADRYVITSGFTEFFIGQAGGQFTSATNDDTNPTTNVTFRVNPVVEVASRATAVTSTVLTDTTENWVDDEHNGRTLTILGVVTSQATGGTSTTLVDSTESWVDDEHNGRFVRLIGGTGEGQLKLITDTIDATNTLVISGTFSPAPDSSTIYRVGSTAAGEKRSIIATDGTAESVTVAPAFSATPIVDTQYEIESVAYPNIVAWGDPIIGEIL